MKCGSYKSADKAKGEAEANNEAEAKSEVEAKNETRECKILGEDDFENSGEGFYAHIRYV